MLHLVRLLLASPRPAPLRSASPLLFVLSSSRLFSPLLLSLLHSSPLLLLSSSCPNSGNFASDATPSHVDLLDTRRFHRNVSDGSG